MSKAAKASGPNIPMADQEVSFEEALKKLEAIVQSMENSDLPLETLLARFEEGAKLAQVCQTRLTEAELKIQQLEKTAAGQIISRPVVIPEESA